MVSAASAHPKNLVFNAVPLPMTIGRSIVPKMPVPAQEDIGTVTARHDATTDFQSKQSDSECGLLALLCSFSSRFDMTLSFPSLETKSVMCSWCAK
jgi:hypothetical protein